MRLPLVATNDVYFPKARLYEAHDALICIKEGAYVDQQEPRRHLTPQHYFKSPQEMATLFADLPEAVENTVEIARRCAFKVAKRDPILPKFADDEVEELRRQAWEGLEARLAVIPHAAPVEEYHARLEFELGIIEQMGFPGYFLIVADFIKWAKDQTIPGRAGPWLGRGLAGRLCAHHHRPRPAALFAAVRALPQSRAGLDARLRHRLLHGPARRGHPLRPGEIRPRQGRPDHHLRHAPVEGRGARRRPGAADALRAGRPAVEDDPGRGGQAGVDRAGPGRGAADCGEEARREEVVARLLDYAQQLEGLLRNASTHAAGVVIGDRPLDELVPLYQDPRSDMPVTQFNMKWVEQAGLVKFDFLGLKTLTVIQNAIDLIHESGRDLHIAPDGTEIYQPAEGAANQINAIPLDDERTYALYASARTVAVFQVESSGMMDALRRMQPTCIEDIVALVALYRPGPMENIPTYCDVKNGAEKRASVHPLIDHILEETHGIIVYQEQVMQIAQVMAGYSLGGADLLRRAMGKKIKEEMDAERPKFVAGRGRERGATRRRRRRSSTCSRSSPTTASTSRTPRPTRWSPTRPPG